MGVWGVGSWGGAFACAFVGCAYAFACACSSHAVILRAADPGQTGCVVMACRKLVVEMVDLGGGVLLLLLMCWAGERVHGTFHPGQRALPALRPFPEHLGAQADTVRGSLIQAAASASVQMPATVWVGGAGGGGGGGGGWPFFHFSPRTGT